MNKDSLLEERFQSMLFRLETISEILKTNMLKDEMEIYDSKTLAFKLGVSTRTLQNWRNSRLIAYFKINGKICYSKEQVEKLLDGFKVNSFTSKTKSYGKH